MSSGIGVNPQCLETFQTLKLGKKNKYIVYALSKDNTEIIVERESPSGDYEEFIATLPEADCRWAVFDFEFEKEGGGKRNKILFVAWCPDDAKVKQKMLFASSKDALRRSLVGLQVEIQATDFSEIAHDVVLEKVSKGA